MTAPHPPTTRSPAGDGWTEETLAVVDRACEHHGGFERWRRIRLIRLVPREPMRGLLLRLKGAGTTFPTPAAFEIAPHERLVRFVDYPRPGFHGLYRDGDVKVVRDGDGADVESSPSHRSTMTGLARLRRWSPLDALFFFGYALVHYHSLPFTLTDGRLVSATQRARAGGTVDILEVELPAEIETHSRRQRFHFDRAGRLLRHDYVADVIGAWARGAHYWNDQRLVAGIPIAFERLVRPRLGSIVLPAIALSAHFASAEIELDEEAATTSSGP